MAVSCPEDCFVSYVQKILQIYQGYTKRYGPGLIDMTFYMSNVDALKTVLSTTCRSLHFYDQVINDPRHAEDGESRVICSWDNVGAVYIPLGLIINNYHAMPLGYIQYMRFRSVVRFYFSVGVKFGEFTQIIAPTFDVMGISLFAESEFK